MRAFYHDAFCDANVSILPETSERLMLLTVLLHQFRNHWSGICQDRRLELHYLIAELADPQCTPRRRIVCMTSANHRRRVLLLRDSDRVLTIRMLLYLLAMSSTHKEGVLCYYRPVKNLQCPDHPVPLPPKQSWPLPTRALRSCP